MPVRVRLNTSMRLSFGGLGPLRIGMTETQIRTVLADNLKSDQPESAEGCKYLDVEGAGLDLMMQNSRLVRIDVNDRKWLSVSGARIGSTGDDIRKLYGPTIRSERNG